MKEKIKDILNSNNSKRAKIYYNLTQLTELTGLCDRTLKYRMNKVKKKYEGIPSLLLREGRSWRIHISIVSDFLPQRSKRTQTINNFHWQTVVTWNLKNDYDVKYHQELVNQIKELIPNNKIYYSIETDGRGQNHTHFVTDLDQQTIEATVNSVLAQYLSWSEYILDVNQINNKYSTVQYLSKGAIASGVLN